jgi:hypothetical protein
MDQSHISEWNVIVAVWALSLKLKKTREAARYLQLRYGFGLCNERSGNTKSILETKNVCDACYTSFARRGRAMLSVIFNHLSRAPVV